MGRLCIQIVANDHPTDARLTPLRNRLGDVVDIREDGHRWSRAELNCGQYRFIDMPGVLAETLMHLVEPKREGRRIVARRILTLDAAALRTGQWSSRTEATRTQIDSVTLTRA